MKYTPVIVGAGVGLIDGQLNQVASLNSHKYHQGIFKVATLLAGAAGELFFDWSPNIDYGLMTAASTLLARQIPQAISDKSISDLGTYQAVQVTPEKQPPTLAGFTQGGFQQRQITPEKQPVTIAGCTACAKPMRSARVAALTAYHTGAH